MDHVINNIISYLDVELDELRRQWKYGNGDYSKLSDCPAYGACNAMVKSIHVLERYYYGEVKTASVKTLVEY